MFYHVPLCFVCACVPSYGRPAGLDRHEPGLFLLALLLDPTDYMLSNLR